MRKLAGWFRTLSGDPPAARGTRVPETPGSPATLVMMLVLWIVGGCLIYTGAVSLPAAIRARPADLADFQ